MTFSPTSKEFKLLLYCILPLTTTLCHWVRKGSVDVPREEKKKQLPAPRRVVSRTYDEVKKYTGVLVFALCVCNPFENDKATHLHSPQRSQPADSQPFSITRPKNFKPNMFHFALANEEKCN